MEPSEIRPAIRIGEGDTEPFTGVHVAVERSRTRTALIGSVPPKLAKMLLPGERVTFGTAVHPIVFVAPLVCLAAIALAALGGIAWVGHHRALAWLLQRPWPRLAMAAGCVLFASSVMLLVKRTARYLGLRIVSTNRRVFAIRGVLIRRITPLGNTALAASTLSQGPLGRMFGYGSIDLPLADGTPGQFRDIRDALQLYREFQAVANGVDGDTWTPAVRQTIIP
jgi:membrane protein YdbS with pleckstrin-like domain